MPAQISHEHEPEWVGVAIRWPDGSIKAYEFRGGITATLGGHRDAPNHPFRRTFKVEAASVREWEQGADAAPQTPQAPPEIETARKAIEA